jgi:uncharacterized protein (DUF58 family)
MISVRRPRDVTLTKVGLVFLLFILLLQLAAFNTGENLFYLLTSGVISFLLVGWWGTRMGIRSLRLTRTAPDAVHRDESFASILQLKNEHSFWPSVGISLNSDDWGRALWLDSIPSGQYADFRAYESMPKRGLHPLPPVQVQTTFPFGLVQRGLVVDDEQTILVYPRTHILSRKVVDELDDSGQTPKVSFRDGDDFFSLREYVVGDDIRHVSWKISARMGRLIIRELEPSISRMVVLVFDTRGVPESMEDSDDFELAMDFTASLAVNLLGLHYIVGLELPDCSIELGRGRGQSTKILETLALANGTDSAVYSDDWYQPVGNHAEASRIFLATDPSRWGVANLQGRGRVLDPRDSLHG